MHAVRNVLITSIAVAGVATLALISVSAKAQDSSSEDINTEPNPDLNSQPLSVMSADSFDLASVAADVDVPLPRSMAALGDSMTAGALAKYKRQSANLPWVSFDFLLHAFAYGLTKSFKAFEFRKYSWSTGSDTTYRTISHARRIAELDGPGKNLKVYNAAVSGDEINDVVTEQIPRLQKWSRERLNQNAPDYVTIFIGANDVCGDKTSDMTSVQAYHDGMVSSVDTLLASNPSTRVLVVGLPNIERLRKVARKEMIWGFRGFGLSCESMWKRLKLCRTLTLEDNPVEREKVALRVSDFNQAAQDVAAKARRDYGDRVRYTNKIYEMEFSKNDLAMDCFHPNYKGQDKLAANTFAASWWSDKWDHRKEQKIRSLVNTPEAQAEIKMDGHLPE